MNNDLNMHYFEAMDVRRRFTEHSINNGVQELCAVGEHCLEYQDEKALIKLIISLLQGPVRCRRIGEAARRQTYQHRSACLLATARRSAKLASPRPGDYLCALLAVNLLGAALELGGRAVSVATSGGYRKVIGWIVMIVLSGLAAIVGMIERIRVFICRA